MLPNILLFFTLLAENYNLFCSPLTQESNCKTVANSRFAVGNAIYF